MGQIVLDGVHKYFQVHQGSESSGSWWRRLRRTRTRLTALEDVSFQVSPGELIGYIGPNGAGKSTSVKIMSGILVPEEGTCRVNGLVPWEHRQRHAGSIGVVFGQRSQLWWDVPVQDSFDLLREVYRVGQVTYKKRLHELVDALQLSSLLQTPVRQLSLGQRMRCEIAAALLHSPDILFLDEPTIGLDAVSKLALRDFLREENRRRGVTMVLTTHDMDDIEALCSRVMVIGRGRILFDGKLTSLKEEYSPLAVVTCELEETVAAQAIPGVDHVEIDGPIWKIHYDPRVLSRAQLVAYLTQHLPLRDLSMADHDIDAIIARMYKEMKL